MSSPNLATVVPVTRDETNAELAPRYHLVLLDDDDHSYEYVVLMLGDLFGYGVDKAYAIACAVDSTGRAIVETASHDRVLTDQRRIHGYGPDPFLARCRGSMSAVVEPAP